MITGRARLAGVIGWPVGHSRSPLLHNFWLRRHGIDGAYVPLAVRPADFAAAIMGLRAAGFAGANVTIPHKEVAVALCDTLDDSARRAGAVNTLVFSEGGILGSNTDGHGFVANLRAHGVQLHGAALLLGAGGAARAIGAALLEAGMVVTIANRTQARAQALADALPGLQVVAWEMRGAAIADCDLLVNTTSLGMQGHDALQIDLRRAHAGLTVADIVYAPAETALLADARARGLMHQAVPGFAAWFGIVPAVDEEVIAAVNAGS
jgi:shikimate dehydrogenase